MRIKKAEMLCTNHVPKRSVAVKAFIVVTKKKKPQKNSLDVCDRSAVVAVGMFAKARSLKTISQRRQTHPKGQILMMRDGSQSARSCPVPTLAFRRLRLKSDYVTAVAVAAVLSLKIKQH